MRPDDQFRPRPIQTSPKKHPQAWMEAKVALGTYGRAYRVAFPDMELVAFEKILAITGGTRDYHFYCFNDETTASLISLLEIAS